MLPPRRSCNQSRVLLQRMDWNKVGLMHISREKGGSTTHWDTYSIQASTRIRTHVYVCVLMIPCASLHYTLASWIGFFRLGLRFLPSFSDSEHDLWFCVCVSMFLGSRGANCSIWLCDKNSLRGGAGEEEEEEVEETVKDKGICQETTALFWWNIIGYGPTVERLQ